MKYFNKNESFFETPNKANSYWAGFIAADGYVDEDKNILSITLSSKDKEHLEQIKNCLNSDYQLRLGKVFLHKTNKEYDTNGFHFASEQTVSDLNRNWGIHQKKTSSIRFPQNLSEENKKSYLCGYIDGDGSIVVLGQKRNKLQLSICGNEEFLNGVVLFLKDNGIKIVNNIYRSKGIYNFSVNGKKAIEILDFLYDEEIPLLRRKWDKYLENRERRFGQYLEWSKEEIELLIEKYKTTPAPQIHKEFFSNRSFYSVEKKLYQLKQKKPNRTPQKNWTTEEEEALLEAVAKGLTTNEIHATLFPYRTFYSIRNRRINLFQRAKK